MPIPIDGKIYTIGGRDFKLYPISTLIAVLNNNLPEGEKRTPQTIRLWERKRIIPPALFKINGIRLYTKEEIEVIVRQAILCDIRQGKEMVKSEFSEKVWEEIETIRKGYFKRGD